MPGPLFVIQLGSRVRCSAWLCRLFSEVIIWKLSLHHKAKQCSKVVMKSVGRLEHNVLALHLHIACRRYVQITIAGFPDTDVPESFLPFETNIQRGIRSTLRIPYRENQTVRVE